jgi:hypothetical protein
MAQYGGDRVRAEADSRRVASELTGVGSETTAIDEGFAPAGHRLLSTSGR